MFNFPTSELYLTISLTLLGLWLFLVLSKPATNLPPGPLGLPVVGYLPFLSTFLHKKFTELASKYGPIYKLWLGNKLCIVISSPSLAKQVFREHDKIFANHEPIVAAKIITYGGNDIAFRHYDAAWQKMRKVFVSKMLSKASIDALYPIRKQEVHDAINDIRTKPGGLIDFGELVLKINVNSAIKMVCGSAFKGENTVRFVEEFREMTGELMFLLAKPNVSDVFPILARFDLQGLQKQARKVHLQFDRMINSVVEQPRVENGEGKREFLQILLDFNKEGNADESLTMDQVKGLIMDIVVGGTDTTATMLEWTMTEIMLNEQVKTKVYQELNQVVGLHNQLEESHLPKLEYLEAVVKEANRLHPALPLLVPHLPSQTCTVGAYTIPKGATVFINVYAIHRDPLYWDNPLEFRPERFLKNANDGVKFDYLGTNFQYLPFGAGRRICAGIPLAERSLMYILGSMLHSFEWELPPGTKLESSDKFGIVVKKRNPLVLTPKPRQPGLGH